MLDFSWATACGIYALHYLARKGRPSTVAEIATHHGGLSRAFLSKTLQRLRRGHLVRSQRGIGYELARPAWGISILDVVIALEGRVPPTDLCVMRNSSCAFRGKCPVSRLCHEINTSVLSALDAVSISSLPVAEHGLPVCSTPALKVASP